MARSDRIHEIFKKIRTIETATNLLSIDVVRYLF